jgi:hypothetical protein
MSAGELINYSTPVHENTMKQINILDTQDYP